MPAAADVVGTLGTLLSGGINGLQSVALSARLPWLEVEAPEGLDLNLDGEPVASRRFRVDCVAGRVRMHLPLACPLRLKPCA